MNSKRSLLLKSWNPNEAPTGPLIVRCGASNVDFSEICAIYGARFGNKFRECLVVGLSEFAESTIYLTALTVKKFLVGIAKLSTGSDCSREVMQFVSGVSGNVDFPVNADLLKAACELFASKIRNPDDTYFHQSRNLKSRDTEIHNLSRFLKFVAPLLGWPTIGAISGIKRAASLSEGRVLALGELVPGISQFSIKPRSDVFVPALNVERTQLVRAHCERVLLNSYVVHLEQAVGMHLVAFESIQVIREKASRESDERITTEDGVRISETRVYQNALRFAEALASGPDALKEESEGRLSLLPVRQAMAAAHAIVLIDSGLNLQVCADLAANPFWTRRKRGQYVLQQIVGVKNRANYQEVSGFLSSRPPANSKMSGVRAVQIWQVLSSGARADAEADVAAFLWILRWRGGVQRATRSQWCDSWQTMRQILNEDPKLVDLPITRNMFRPTYLQMKHHAAGGDVELVRALAGHRSSNTTSRHYLNRAYMKRAYDDKIREFQRLFEAVFDSSGTRARLFEISEEELKRRYKKAVDTGLGYVCLDPWAGAQPGQSGWLCSRLDACSRCPMLSFRVSAQALDALVLFRRSLERAFEAFVSMNAERWQLVWMPALALCVATMDRVKQSASRVMLARSENAVDEGLAAGRLKYFQPW